MSLDHCYQGHDVSPPNLAKQWVIGFRDQGAEAPVKQQSDTVILKPNLAVVRLHGIWREDTYHWISDREDTCGRM